MKTLALENGQQGGRQLSNDLHDLPLQYVGSPGQVAACDELASNHGRRPIDSSEELVQVVQEV